MKSLAILALLAPAIVQAQGPAYEVLHVRGNVYMFASDSGNVTVQVGTHADNDGVLLVDTGTAQLAERMLAEVQKLTDKPIRFVINTSADADHTGGNAAIASQGDARSAGEGGNSPGKPEIGFYAHDNVLMRMSRAGSGVPAAAWPSLTFVRQKDFTFNGEPVQLFPEAPAHTDGDGIAFFRGSNVISAGEIFTTTGYPMIDLTRGGSIQGEIKALNHIIDLTVPEIMQEGGTMVIPGHGRLCDEADVVEYRDMVTIVRDRVADLVKKGKSLDEVKEARVSRDYDSRYSQPAWTGDMFVEAIYKSLKGGQK
jgi:cyclase